MQFKRVLFFTLGLFSSPLAAQTVTLSPGEVFGLSVQALQAGDAGTAIQGADALLQRDPNDINALVLRAEAAIATGAYGDAVTYGQRAFFAAPSSDASFAAARIVALAHAEQQQDTRAQIWLRLASNYAPNVEAAQSVAQDYQFLRDRNPWSTSLRFGITPSSNINNGSAATTTRLFGLPFEFELDGEARALSGLEYSGGVTTTYRLAATDTAATFFELDVNARTYTLSAEAEAQAPDVSGGDFADASVTMGLIHRFVGRPGDEPTTLRFSVGQTWYGGDPNTRFAELFGAHAWRVGDADRLTLGITARRTEGLADQDPLQSYAIAGGWSHAFASGDVGQLNYTYQVNISDTADSDYTSNKIGANYTFAQPFFGVNFGFGLEYELREFDASRYAPGPREDATTTARIRAVVSEVEYFGFQPVISVEGTRTESNIDLFDREYLRVGFDLQSSF